MCAGTPDVQQIMPQVPQFPPAIDCGPAPTYVHPATEEVALDAVSELLKPTFEAKTLTVVATEFPPKDVVIVAPDLFAVPAEAETV